MGQSTDGILCYGVALVEEWGLPKFMEGFDDFEDYLYHFSGLPEYGTEGYSWEKKREFLDTQPVEMVLHCSYDCPMYIIAVRRFQTTAYRGNPVSLGQSLEVPSGNQIQHFMQWMSERGYENIEPEWILASMWG